MSWSFKYSKETLDITLSQWQPRSQEKLTYQDAVEIIDNASGFYGTLLRWAREAEEQNGESQEPKIQT